MKKTIYIIAILIFLIGCKTKVEPPLSKKLDKDEEIFLINTKSDTLIEGKEGTLIFIEKESFINQYGTLISDSIKIVLKELYQIEDIIAQKISMKSNGKILETGGMIHLQAFSKGDELKLQYGKEVVVHFPKKETDLEMHLFYGNRDSVDIVEWDLEESSTYLLRTEIIEWYTKYEYLDDSTLYLADGRNSYDTVFQHFSLDKIDEEELVNKNIRANYIVYDNGELEYQNITGSKISRRLKNKIKSKVKSYPKCKPYTRESVPIDMPGFFAIQSRVIPPLYKSKENYLESIEQKLSDGNPKTLELAELQYYIFDSKNLGWMNCDRFINTSSERINYIVKVPKSKNVFVKIVFTNYKTVMTGNEKRGRFFFDDLPINEPVKIIVLDERKGKPLLKIVDTTTTKKPIELKDLTEYTLEELKEKLKEMN